MNGELAVVDPTDNADLVSEGVFQDMKLHIEFNVDAKSNSGVFLRGRYEIQILDNPDAKMALDSHGGGGVYSRIAPKLDATKPAGEWQAYDITLVGRQITVVLNGKTIVEDVVEGITGSAPQVTFVATKGDSISTDSLRGQVVLVNFWATDCVTCIREMPAITGTYGKYRDRGFETIAVAMRHDPPKYVLDYVPKNRLPFKVALDPLCELARAFDDVRLTPTTIVIDKQGKIVARILGEPDFAKLHALIEKELTES